MICLDYFYIIIYPLNKLLVHGRWDAAVCVDPVSSKQQAINPFALNDKEGREQSLGPDHQVHVHAALGI
jgi:hypothetical protein